jgi:hypothetical protein
MLPFNAFASPNMRLCLSATVSDSFSAGAWHFHGGATGPAVFTI